MTLAEMWRDKGTQQGMEMGEAATLSKTAIRLLTKKFHFVPKDIKESISKLDMLTIELLIDDILESKTVADSGKYLQ